MKLLFFIMIFAPSIVSADPIWIVSPNDVMSATEPVLVLDARESLIKRKAKGAIKIEWKDFSGKDEKAGTLRSTKEIVSKLRKLGVRNDVPIAVLGDGGSGWGADGRIVWMLRALGHDRTYWVNGGLGGLKDAGYPGSLEFSKKSGNFEAQIDLELHAESDAVKDAIKGDAVLVDTREPREFKGKTPYGEVRGGHVPTSIPLHFSTLFEDKVLKTAPEIEKVLSAAGITKDVPVIAYCTGGVRSAMFVVILRHLGYDAKNYAGSMWLWSSLDPASYPLEK